MKVKQLASNMTEVTANGVSVLFSYNTPVAGWDDEGAFRTDQHYSKTTTNHINKYLGKGVGRAATQSYIDSLFTPS